MHDKRKRVIAEIWLHFEKLFSQNHHRVVKSAVQFSVDFLFEVLLDLVLYGSVIDLGLLIVDSYEESLDASGARPIGNSLNGSVDGAGPVGVDLISHIVEHRPGEDTCLAL